MKCGVYGDKENGDTLRIFNSLQHTATHCNTCLQGRWRHLQDSAWRESLRHRSGRKSFFPFPTKFCGSFFSFSMFVSGSSCTCACVLFAEGESVIVTHALTYTRTLSRRWSLALWPQCLPCTNKVESQTFRCVHLGWRFLLDPGPSYCQMTQMSEEDSSK